MLKIIKYNELDEPKNAIEPDVMYKNAPFFNDYYVTIHLKKLFVTENQYVPIILEDLNLQENYYLNNLESHITNILGKFEKIYSPVSKISVYLFELKPLGEIGVIETINPPTPDLRTDVEKKWCIYIVKKYIWKVFTYTCIITIFCDSVDVLNKYFDTYFFSEIQKTKFRVKN